MKGLIYGEVYIPRTDLPKIRRLLSRPFSKRITKVKIFKSDKGNFNWHISENQ